MLKMAVDYRAAIDNITANKTLKMRQHELDEEDWAIIVDLLQVLKVRCALIVDRIAC
jgi:hypothetical protein